MILGAMIAFAAFGPLVSPWRYDEVFWDAISTPPDAAHWLGTDVTGRDLFVRVAYGARVSLLIGFAATSMGLGIGGAYGLVAGYSGRWTEAAMMRVVDVLHAMPFLFTVILMTVVFGRGLAVVLVAIGLVEWLDVARIARIQAKGLKRAEFIDAARALGAGHVRILFRHMAPNMLGPILAYAVLIVPRVIVLESFLSFLGLGVQEPAPSWGGIISEGSKTVEFAPWALAAPSALVAMTLLGLALIGDSFAAPGRGSA